MKILLLIYVPDEYEFLDSFSKLPVLRGTQVKCVSDRGISTATEVTLLAKKAGASGVICSSAHVLKLLLEAQVDYTPNQSRRAISLDDYAGSILIVPNIGTHIAAVEAVVIQPLTHLRIVSYGKFLHERFISKLTAPESWYPQTEFKWEVFDVNNTERCNELYEMFSTADFIADDIETIVGDEQRRIAVCGFTAYFRRTHSTLSIVIPFSDVAGWVWSKRFGELPVRKVFQNGLYDNTYKARWNCLPVNWLWDTQHLFHSWYSELPKRLDFITAFSVRKVRYWKDDGKTGNLHDYYRYNALDTWATLNSCLALVHEMPDWAIANYVEEFPKVFPCLHCGLEGLAVDEERFDKVAAETELALDERLKRLQYLVATPGFNPSSSQQVMRLFQVLGIKGLTSTDKAAMLKAKATSTFNELILNEVTNYREDRKLNGTYFVKEKLWYGRLYYALNPAGTDTGRLASKESAFWCGLQIQNIPRGPEFKQCIIADPGWLLCEPDKAQSEARCVGYLSGETKLIQVLENPNIEFHSHNASAFFGVPYETIYANGKVLDKDLRDLSKRTNHGANYNMGEDVMLDTMGPKNVIRAKRLLRLPAHLSLRRVTRYLLDAYAKTYPKVKGLWYESIVKRITITHRLVSPMGWTRYFFGNPAKNKRDLNSAVAHEPQNLSVSIINREFYNLWAAQVYGELQDRIRIKAQIHDSILFQYRETEPEIPTYVRDTYMMTSVQVKGADDVTRTMLIPTDISPGKHRWSELK